MVLIRQKILGVSEMELNITHKRKRIGCDICKKDEPTECFIGYCGNVLWICGSCFHEVTELDGCEGE